MQRDSYEGQMLSLDRKSAEQGSPRWGGSLAGFFNEVDSVADS